VPVPQLSEDQIGWIIQRVAEYIERQRDTHKSKAVPLDRPNARQCRPTFRHLLWIRRE
jgi:hypothetical protein